MLSRLRGSGQIQEAADNVFLIYRPEIYNKTSYHDFPNIRNVNGTAELIWAKGRNTGLHQCVVGFDNMTTRFYDKTFTDYNNDTNKIENSGNDDVSYIPIQKGALPF